MVAWRMLLVVGVGGVAACGSSEGDPLGGPFGGTGGKPVPSSNVAATVSPRPQPDGGGLTGDVPPHVGPPETFTQVFTKYLAQGTVGECPQCHGAFDTPANAYAYLVSEAQIGGAKPDLIDPTKSCLTWYGGGMPPDGPTSLPEALSDMQSWVDNGAKND